MISEQKKNCQKKGEDLVKIKARPSVGHAQRWMEKIQKHANNEQIEVISEKVLQCGRDTGRLYDLMNNISGTTKENLLPDHTNEETLAKEFAEFFLEKIQMIQRELDDKPKYQPICTAPAEAKLTVKILS